jgi:hypothetical protein
MSKLVGMSTVLISTVIFISASSPAYSYERILVETAESKTWAGAGDGAIVQRLIQRTESRAKSDCGGTVTFQGIHSDHTQDNDCPRLVIRAEYSCSVQDDCGAANYTPPYSGPAPVYTQPPCWVNNPACVHLAGGVATGPGIES